MCIGRNSSNVSFLNIYCRSDFENASDRLLIIASSLATILSKNFAARNPNNSHLLEKCPTFVSKEKKSKAFLGGLKPKKNVQVWN